MYKYCYYHTHSDYANVECTCTFMYMYTFIIIFHTHSDYPNVELQALTILLDNEMWDDAVHMMKQVFSQVFTISCFYGQQGHPYNCFPRDLTNIYVCVTYATMHCIFRKLRHSLGLSQLMGEAHNGMCTRALQTCRKKALYFT